MLTGALKDAIIHISQQAMVLVNIFKEFKEKQNAII